MKISWFIYSILILLFLEGCVSFKKELVQKGNQADAIQNAILDFSNTTRLYKKDTVFSVQTEEIGGEVLVVSIGKNNMKMLLTESTKVGSIGKLPSRYVEINGKLFYWWDNDYILSEDAIAVFHKYNLLQDDEGGIIKFPDFIIDDAQKAAHYYFCKNDLTKYKKVITNIGIGYYDTPGLKCNQ
jgi:starvation-inducible outer membrane lipoprotein